MRKTATETMEKNRAAKAKASPKAKADPMTEDKKKTIVCKFFKKGACDRDDCKFSHDPKFKAKKKATAVVVDG